MKATVDLPKDLIKEVKLRAVHGGRKFRDEMADLLRAGLTAAKRPAAGAKRLKSARVKTDRKTGLPVIACGRNAPARKMSAAQIIKIEQETQTQEDLERFGTSD